MNTKPGRNRIGGRCFKEALMSKMRPEYFNTHQLRAEHEMDEH